MLILAPRARTQDIDIQKAPTILEASTYQNTPPSRKLDTSALWIKTYDLVGRRT